MKLNENIAWAKKFYNVYKPFKQIFASNAEKNNLNICIFLGNKLRMVVNTEFLESNILKVYPN